MAKILDHQLFDIGLRRYFEVTTPTFDRAMGQRLKSWRQTKMMSQAELADRLGTNQTTIQRLETGKLRCAPFNSAQLKNVMNDAFQYLLTTDGYYRYEEIRWEYDKRTNRWVGHKKNV